MKKETVWACSDLHGFYDGYVAIKKYIKPKDKVICLGDCGDRGPEPWKTITAVYNDPQFIYLKGNHEDLLVNAIREWQGEYNIRYDFCLLATNGGYHTFNSWRHSPERNKWCNKLVKLPLMFTYTWNNQTIILSHAGFTPPDIPVDKELLWNRAHFEDKWIDNDNVYIVHGHTPVQHFVKHSKEIYRYCNGHKIDIDLGTIKSKRIALLNLQTLEPVYFEV